MLRAARCGCGPTEKAPVAPPAKAQAPAPAPAPAKAKGPADFPPPVFEERALAAGLKFQMAFLPTEHGEKFKINLYDHGCGVAVADFDGDGHDDIYF